MLPSGHVSPFDDIVTPVGEGLPRKSQRARQRRPLLERFRKLHPIRRTGPHNPTLEREHWLGDQGFRRPRLRSALDISVRQMDSCVYATDSPVGSAHDNAKFASSGGDRSVFLWDVATGVTTRRIPGHMGKIHVVEFNEDATVVASGKPTASFHLAVTYSRHCRLV